MSKEDLIHYKPGQSGNPKGRKKGSKNRSTIAKEMLEFVMSGKDLNGADIEASAEELMTMSVLLKAVKDGDINAYKAIQDSAYGTPKQTIEQNNINQKPRQIRFTDGERSED